MIIQESIISRGCDYYDTYLTLSWEEECKLFCDSEDRVGEESFIATCNVIRRKDKINNKRKKHNKDGRINTWWAQHRHGDRYGENKLIKHKRAEKMFTSDEYFEDAYIDVDAGYWAVYDYENGFYEEEEQDNWWLCEQFPTEEDYLIEMGDEHLGDNFDWEEELVESGFYDDREDDKEFIKNIVIDKRKLKLA